ncbi:hypothetical protein RB595_006230 [Gaeumannomyces hyphopodioides]
MQRQADMGIAPAAASGKVTAVQYLIPPENGASSRLRLLYASWVDKHKRACGPDGTPEGQTDTSGVVGVLSHKFDAEKDEVRMLVLWKAGLRRANTWELEDAVHRHQPEMLSDYWRARPPGSREAALEGTGHESEIFALWYPPLLRRAGGEWELAVEVEYCGYSDVNEVAADLLDEDLKHLMTEYWRRLGGRPKVL